MTTGATRDRYLVISADCHGGAAIHQYRDYLERRYHDEFDAWVRDFAIPWRDVRGDDGDRNWDHDRRLRALEADGIAAEVIFPNTIPPFYPEPSLMMQPPAANEGDLALRWAGLRAHNRWLADFCGQLPGRRAGIAEILLHDVDAAVAEIRWAREAGLTGGILLPGVPPDAGIPPLYVPDYEPIWSVCAELGMPVNHHTGSAAPRMGEYPVSKVILLLEVTWWAHRALWHLVFSGVLERHPDLQLVFTEQGTAWVPETLATLDYFYGRMRASGGSQEEEWGGDVVASLELRPSEYWARQCHVGASFIRPTEVPLRGLVGVDRIMWGSDYPHLEASYPYSREAMRLAFAGVDPSEVQAMVGGNAAWLYGFDLDLLESVAARIGPTVAEISEPLDSIPPGAERCPAFAPAPIGPNQKAGSTA